MNRLKKIFCNLIVFTLFSVAMNPSLEAIASTFVQAMAEANSANNLVNIALNKKTFVDYLNAYSAILQLPQNSQGELLVKLDPVTKQIPDYDQITTLYNKVIAFSTNKDVITYDYLVGDGTGTNGAIIEKIKTNKVDRDFIYKEVYTYALNVLNKDQKPVQDARHELVNAYMAFGKGDLNSAKAYVENAKRLSSNPLVNAANLAYLNSEIKNYEKIISDYEANLLSNEVYTLSANGDKEILVTFKKSMNVNTITGIIARDENSNNVSLGIPIVVFGSDNKQFLIPIVTTLYSNSTKRTITLEFPHSIQDVEGNNIATKKVSVTLVKDNTKPVSTGYKIIKDAYGNVVSFEFYFNKSLNTASVSAMPTIINLDGQVVANFLAIDGYTTTLVAQPVLSGDKKLVYSFGGNRAVKINRPLLFSFEQNVVTDKSEGLNGNEAFYVLVTSEM